MKILLACSAGMSTSLLEKTLNEHMAQQNVKGEAVAYDSGKAKTLIDEFDVILLGPQVRFMLNDFKEIAKGKPVGVIEPADYAMARAKPIFELAKKLLSEK